MDKKLTKTVLFHRLTITTINADDTVSRQVIDCKSITDYNRIKKMLNKNQIIESDELYEQTYKFDYSMLQMHAVPDGQPKPHVKRGSRVLN